MSARNLVRGLRDSGALATQLPGSAWRFSVMVFALALAFGAVAYLGAAYGLPSLLQAMEKKPPPVFYAKPG